MTVAATQASLSTSSVADSVVVVLLGDDVVVDTDPDVGDCSPDVWDGGNDEAWVDELEPSLADGGRTIDVVVGLEPWLTGASATGIVRHALSARSKITSRFDLGVDTRPVTGG
jgi:hypothetical protein